MPNNSIYAPVPASYHDAVAQAINATFAGLKPQSLTPLRGGFSGAPIFTVVVEDQPYVLRVIRSDGLLTDPERQFACMTIAAKRGIAPPVYYADVQTGISITERVATQPITTALQSDPALLKRLGNLLHRLHTGPAFPVFQDPFQFIQSILATIAATKVSLPNTFQSYLARFEAVQTMLQPHLISAPCHNDVNLGNLLFDGSELWLIDWETACMADPLFDLATVIHWFGLTATQEAALLHAYFGAAPDEWQWAKLELMKQVSWCFYAMIYMMIALHLGQKTLPPTLEQEALPCFADAVRAIGNGTMKPYLPDTSFTFSLVIVNEALKAMNQPAFARACAIIGA